jgi:5-methyltetrahydropteroyltriglutamate--homocysteine methyltransferase
LQSTLIGTPASIPAALCRTVPPGGTLRTSTERILTTHVGSLPRNATLSDLLIREEAGEVIDKALLSAESERAVRHVVEAQSRAGVDVINDGEQPRVGFQTYVVQRMSGFGGESKRPRPLDFAEFPAYAAQMGRRFPRRSKVSNAPQAISEVRYEGLAAADRECELFEAALERLPVRPADIFMTAASPGIIATTLLNAHYESHERYVFALAEQMRVEYERIARDFVLQIDAPDLAMEKTMLFQDRTNAEFLAIVEMHIAALNQAVAAIPKDRIRLHCCWGNWDGPHTHDIPLSEVLPLLFTAKVGALSLEFSNPRHQHEYRALKAARLPDDMLLLPGVIDSTTNYVEHPEVVANRICEAVDAVGDRTRVIASSDCGFGTFAGGEFVAEDVVWAKLRSCREGADIATKRLWGRVDA